MADFARGERLRELRDQRHLSQEDAAHEIGVSVKTVRSWEKGGGIRWDNAKHAATFYGVDPESLVSRENGDSPTSIPIPEISQLDRIEEALQALQDQQAQVLSELSLVHSALERQRKPKERGERGGASSRT